MLSAPSDYQIRPASDAASPPAAACAADAPFAESREPVLRKGAVSIIDQAIVSGVNFLTVAIVARACSPAEVGVYALAWTVVLFITVAQSNLISIPYTMYRHRREGGALAEYGGSAMVHQLVLSAAAAVCFVGLAAALSLGAGPSGLRPAAWLLSGAIPFILLRDFARRFSFAHLAPETAVVMDLAVSAVQVACLLALWRMDLLSAATAYAVMGAACAAAVAGWWLVRKQPLRFSRAAVVRDWRQNWAFGRWTITGQASGLGFYALPWLLAFVHGEAETGRLAACTTLVGLSNLFVMGLNNYLMPRAAQSLAKNGAGELAAVLRKAMLASAAVLGALTLGAFLVGDHLATIVFGPTYAGTGALLTVLAAAALADSFGQTASAGLWTIDRPAANLAADLVQVAATLVAAVWLVFPLGALGIALAILAGRAVGVSARCCLLWGLMNAAKRNRELGIVGI